MKNTCPTVLPLERKCSQFTDFPPRAVSCPMRQLYSSLALLLSLYAQSFAFFGPSECRGDRPGDCDPASCGGTCEARYIRFYDRGLDGDRTYKSCQCVETRTCSIIGMHSSSGCRSYSSLGTAAQRLIRNWSVDSRDRKNKHSNDVRKRFSDKLRHQQLVNGHSRFCCRAVGPQKRIVMRLRSSAALAPLPLLLLVVF